MDAEGERQAVSGAKRVVGVSLFFPLLICSVVVAPVSLSCLLPSPVLSVAFGRRRDACCVPFLSTPPSFPRPLHPSVSLGCVLGARGKKGDSAPSSHSPPPILHATHTHRARSLKKEEYKRLATLVERARANDPRIKNAREAERLRCVRLFGACLLACAVSWFLGGGGRFVAVRRGVVQRTPVARLSEAVSPQKGCKKLINLCHTAGPPPPPQEGAAQGEARGGAGGAGGGGEAGEGGGGGAEGGGGGEDEGGAGPGVCVCAGWLA